MRKSRNQLWTVDYFEERSIPEPNSGCWLWLKAAQQNGYGVVRFQQKTHPAHRLLYELATGQKVPRNMDVCHTCDNRLCVNPEHLFVGSRKDNMDDCVRKGRFHPIVPTRGEDCPAAKLTEQQVLAIRADTRSNRKLAREYGVDKGTISHIRRRLSWRHI